MTKTCLIIVFNHRYDKNIPVLERIYGNRFSAIYYLVPFYNGDDPRVIPVYESSNYFQSFFGQAYHRFYKEEYSHYLFLADDCILNPGLNENNIHEQTGLQLKADFIPGLVTLHSFKREGWIHAERGIDFFNNRMGAEIAEELPDREEAIRRFKEHGITIQALSKENIFGNKKIPYLRGWQSWIYKEFFMRMKWKAFRKNGKIELPYPVAVSYSDILIITKDTITEFCRYCGIMASAGLFVEMAIPTALLLLSKKIMQEKDIRLQGKAIWSDVEKIEIERTYNHSLSALITGFPPDQLFYHPVKLSKWNNDL